MENTKSFRPRQRGERLRDYEILRLVAESESRHLRLDEIVRAMASMIDRNEVEAIVTRLTKKSLLQIGAGFLQLPDSPDPTGDPGATEFDAVKVSAMSDLRKADGPKTADQVAQDLGQPVEVVRRALNNMVHTGLLQVDDSGPKPLYSPRKPTEQQDPLDKDLAALDTLYRILNDPGGVVRFSMSAPRGKYVTITVRSPGYRVDGRKVKEAYVTILDAERPFVPVSEEVIEATPNKGVVEITLDCPELGPPITRSGQKVILVTNPL